ncbi:Formation of crista junctions protein 1 [Agyrium rufum]|nr:Formation of crista junctions protein 1 [Agyrium rufum]
MRWVQLRSFADTSKPIIPPKPSIKSSEAAVFPGSQSQTVDAPIAPPPGLHMSPATPTKPTSSSIIPPENIPIVPAPPAGVQSQRTSSTIPPPTAPSTNVASNPPPPPPPSPKKTHRLRNFMLSIFLLSTLSYAGGVAYSLRSDNFHDFFTEYVPFGEEAVFYFEEREYRRRFPNATKPTNRPAPPDASNRVTIPSKSGVSWKIAEDDTKGSDLETKGRHMSALDANHSNAQVEGAKRNPVTATGPEKTKAVESVKKDTPPAAKPSPPPESPKPVDKPAPKPAAPPPSEPAESKSLGAVPSTASQPPSGTAAKTSPARDPKKNPEVNEPNVFTPVKQISPISFGGSADPAIVELTKVVNDLITMVNLDGTSGKYASALEKARSELQSAGKKILGMRKVEREKAAQKIAATQTDFETAAKELVRRLEAEMQDQGSQWKEEFESEREKISQSYQEQLKSEVERNKRVTEQRIQNQLLEQAVTMKKQFLSEVTDRVEKERDGRLAKLSELSNSVNELEKLTSEWNSVIDANLKTQHLQVALDAVRTSLEQADRPRPFVKELAALKEIAEKDPLVDTAIASVSPPAYQRGVFTSAQLIDRFRRVAAEVRKASLLPEDAGLASHASSLLLSKVLFKKQGLATGDDVESILTRTESFLKEGNLDDAAREMNMLTGWAKTLSNDWLSDVRKVLEVRQALDVISTEARLQGLKVD